MINKEKEVTELVKLLEQYQQELITEEEFYEKSKRRILEMARDKDYILQLFDSKKYPIILHLINCYMWTESHWYSHWKDEIYSFLFELPKLKTTKKYPTRDDLEKWFIEEVKENLDDRINKYVKDAAYNEKNLKLPKYNEKSLYDYLLEYFVWLCDNISDGKSISKKLVSEEVDYLINKYK